METPVTEASRHIKEAVGWLQDAILCDDDESTFLDSVEASYDCLVKAASILEDCSYEIIDTGYFDELGNPSYERLIISPDHAAVAATLTKLCSKITTNPTKTIVTQTLTFIDSYTTKYLEPMLLTEACIVHAGFAFDP